MSKLKWLDSYHKLLADKPDMGEIEWRFDCFKEYIVQKGLGYPARLIRSEKSRTDIRLITPDGISHIVIETKINDTDLENIDPNDKKSTLSQAIGYLHGGESYIVLASPKRMRLFSPRGTHIDDIWLTEGDLQTNVSFWQLSYDYMSQKKHLEPFREGKFDYCYIPVHTSEGFEKFISALRLCGSLLLRHLGYAWVDLRKQYAEYQQKFAELEEQTKNLENLAMAKQELDERMVILAKDKSRLIRQYAVAIEVMEQSFPAFGAIQPYSRDVEAKELVDIYLADITYAALNRLLFVRIAEDKGLLKRKISNGGIGVWRNFTTYLKDKYQDLLIVAYKDAGNIYEHFFEQGIFDWYIRGNSKLNEALETILFLLNAFDLSKVDRDTLGDLYEAYLNPKERKKLGEFYTPREVVDYILRHIGWEGRGTLLDPACGSAGFLVRAANILLKDMENRGISDPLRIQALGAVVGLDINPFATNIAEMNILFLILDVYLKAKEEAEKAGKVLKLERLPIYTVDSLSGVLPGIEGGATRSLGAQLVHVGSVEEALTARDKLDEYDYLVMNPPYVRNERLPQEPRQIYRHLFKDVAAMNADIFTYFMRKAMVWLKDDAGKLGVIVSLGLADSGANEKLRKYLSGYTIERVVPLEWCQVFVANVNPILLFLKKATPPPGHKFALVQGIRSLEDLDKDKGEATYIGQERWLDLAPDGSWRVEVKEGDLPILGKMRDMKCHLNGEYGMTLRGTAQGRNLIADDPDSLENPYRLLDGREIKAWSIEWQGRYIDYQPELISDPKTLEFFKSPKVVVRRISLTTQATVDDSPKASYLARDTVMVARSTSKELNDHPFVIAALMNSLPIRYYAFLMLRAGVLEGSHRSTFYPRVIGSLPTPEAAWKDGGIRSRLDSLSHQAHALASEMVNGDKELLKDVETLIGNNLVPFAHLPESDLSGYLAEVDLATALVSDDGQLTSSKMGIIKGHPAILEYIVARASLQGRDSLAKSAIESFLVPRDMGACIEALHQMDIWAQRKPTLSVKLTEAQAEIDDLALSAFTTLTPEERKYIRERCKQFPLNQVLVTDIPGAPTKRISIKYWETGERYKD